MITHIVQAKCSEGWMDSRKATSFEDAKRQETELLADDDAWMPCHHGANAVPRLTMVVDVSASRCAHLYNRAE